MPNIMRLLHSNTAGNKPASLSVGILAINHKDRTMFTLGPDGSTVENISASWFNQVTGSGLLVNNATGVLSLDYSVVANNVAVEANFANNTELAANLANFTNTVTLSSSYVNNTTIANYSNTTQIAGLYTNTVTLQNTYVTNSAFTANLGNYVLSTTLTTNYSNTATIAGLYVNTASLSSNLANYPTNTQFQANLANYSNTTFQNTNSFQILGRRTAVSAAIANTETQIVSGTIPANKLAVGSMIMLTATGTMTATAATAANGVYRIRIGTATLTGSAVAVSTYPTAASTCSNFIVFVKALVLVTAIGTGGAAIGQVAVNGGNISVVSVAGTTATAAVNTTVSNIAEFTFISGLTTTSITWTNAAIELVV